MRTAFLLRLLGLRLAGGRGAEARRFVECDLSRAPRVRDRRETQGAVEGLGGRRALEHCGMLHARQQSSESDPSYPVSVSYFLSPLVIRPTNMSLVRGWGICNKTQKEVSVVFFKLVVYINTINYTRAHDALTHNGFVPFNSDVCTLHFTYCYGLTYWITKQ